jgi:hypothetical protein
MGMQKNVLSLLIVLLLLLGCTQDDVLESETGNIAFYFSEDDTKVNGRWHSDYQPAFVLLSIEKASGEIVENNKKIPLYRFSTGYLSQDLLLETGEYKLTQFMVLDAGNEVVYATPREESPLAQHVTDPLPIDFKVSEESSTMVTPEVLDVTDQNTAHDFGYATFSFEIAGNKGKVKKVIFTDLFLKAENPITTTLRFEYKHGKVETIQWNFDLKSEGLSSSYLEKRFYSADGNLVLLDGNRLSGEKWTLYYKYKNGLRDKITSKRNDSTETVTFTAYNGSKPLHVENLNVIYGLYDGLDYFNNTTFEFDVTGNLISKKNTGIPGFPNVVEETKTIYSSEINPLQNLIETPFPNVLEYYDDLAFYYSTNLPLSVEANFPYVDPIHNRITFEYEKDAHGKVIKVKASRPDNQSLRYILDITYY